MSTRVLDINVYIVYSDPSVQVLAEAMLRTVGDTAETAAHNVIKLIEESIPKGRVCSLVVTQKDTEYEETGDDDES
jgi:hypothetical protein